MLLSRVATGSWSKVLRLQNSTLSAASVAKNLATIQSTFEEARAKQPSLVVMDDLQKLSDEHYITAICEALDQIKGTRVLVVAACRSPTELNSSLLNPGRFTKKLELSIPDLNARTLILDALLCDESDVIKHETSRLSARTHGFTGKDLAGLVEIAQGQALERAVTQEAHDEHVEMNEPVDMLDGAATENGTRTNDSAPMYDLSAADFDFALTQIRPTALGEFFSETPKIRWTDIGGSDAIKTRFDTALGWPLKHGELLQEYKMRPQKGVLLYGPPGCSKTLTAQAVAANYDMNFIAVKGAELVSMYVGESERAVREVFRKARTAKPCVIFFDEIDSIASERESGGTKGLNVLTTLLNEMDGFESHAGVLVLAATNKPEALDSAIMRPGRFDQHIYLPPPNVTARKEIFTIEMKGRPREDDLDFTRLVAETEGSTGAEIVQICHLATEEALGRRIAGQAGIVGFADFEKALGLMPKGVTEKELRAYEAFAAPKK